MYTQGLNQNKNSSNNSFNVVTEIKSEVTNLSLARDILAKGTNTQFARWKIENNSLIFKESYLENDIPFMRFFGSFKSELSQKLPHLKEKFEFKDTPTYKESKLIEISYSASISDPTLIERIAKKDESLKEGAPDVLWHTKSILEGHGYSIFTIKNNKLALPINDNTLGFIQQFMSYATVNFPYLKKDTDIKVETVSIQSDNGEISEQSQLSISIINPDLIRFINDHHNTLKESAISNSTFNGKAFYHKDFPREVRPRVGTIVSLCIDEGMISVENVEQEHTIPNIEFTQEKGMEIKFPDSLYALKFIIALRKAGYSHIDFNLINESNRYVTYTASVTISNLKEVKGFIEGTPCNLNFWWTGDLALATGLKFDLEPELGESKESIEDEGFENIPDIILSENNGLTLNFAHLDDAKKLVHALENAGYNEIFVKYFEEANKAGYDASIVIKDLNSFKKLIESYCGAGSYEIALSSKSKRVEKVVSDNNSSSMKITTTTTNTANTSITATVIPIATNTNSSNILGDNPYSFHKPVYDTAAACIDKLNRIVTKYNNLGTKKERGLAFINKALVSLETTEIEKFKKRYIELTKNAGSLNYFRQERDMNGTPKKTFSDNVNTHKKALEAFDKILNVKKQIASQEKQETIQRQNDDFFKF